MAKKFIYTIGICCTVFCTLVVHQASAQFKVRGTVYDSSGVYPLTAVSVLSTSGKGTFTDINGNYEIEVGEKDSIWFSYLGKPTIKYPVLKMSDPFHFDISIKISIPVLKEVRITPRNYRLDSIQNRIDYAKIFNYEKPKLKPNISGVGVGFDLDEIIGIFQFRKNKMMLKFQQRLLQQEQDKFIDHRFNKQLVRRLTNLSGDTLDNFMNTFRPSYQFTATASEYDFQAYIKKCCRLFVNTYPAYLKKENN